jgi:hypothetical protein
MQELWIGQDSQHRYPRPQVIRGLFIYELKYY